MTEDSHSQFHKLVQASLDGPLGEAERCLVEAHLVTCPACRQYAAELGALQTGLSRLMKKRWKAGFDPDPRILQNIQSGSRRLAMRKWVFRIAGGIVVIGIFIFVFSGVLSGLGSRSPLQPAAVMPAQETATSAADNSAEACQSVAYTVQPKDTLSLIATNYAVPVESLKEWNGLANDMLTPGMQLVIPLCMRTADSNASATGVPPVALKNYVVQAGDTCASIAALFNVPPADLIQQNHLSAACSDLTIGQDLKIPAPAEIDIRATAFPILGVGACASVQVHAKGTGLFIWPTDKHTLSGTDYDPKLGHFGLDLTAAQDDPIMAADAGVVIYSGWNDWGYGNLVALDHGNGWQTLYAHLDVVKVTCGQFVSQGSVIGLAGVTGHTTRPHLHFEMILNGTHVNPWTVLPKP
jgi:murein DD-endopeptidase MepM/ murein hydrolase activator NlpD